MRGHWDTAVSPVQPVGRGRLEDRHPQQAACDTPTRGGNSMVSTPGALVWARGFNYERHSAPHSQISSLALTSVSNSRQVCLCPLGRPAVPQTAFPRPSPFTTPAKPALPPGLLTSARRRLPRMHPSQMLGVILAASLPRMAPASTGACHSHLQRLVGICPRVLPSAPAQFGHL